MTILPTLGRLGLRYVALDISCILAGLLEDHDRIPKSTIRVPPPHGAKRLQECDAISALGKGEGPQRRRLDQRP